MTSPKDEIVQAQFWDSKYVNSNGDEPTHEWFGASSVQKLFQQNLFDVPGLKPENDPLILHLGSGDSVSHTYSNGVSSNFSTVADSF
jgi:hypothetical protein